MGPQRPYPAGMGSRLSIAVAVATLACLGAAPGVSVAARQIGIGQNEPAPSPSRTVLRTADPVPPPADAQGGNPSAGATASGAEAVTIRDFSFNPKGETVQAGDTVTWTNDGKVKTGHTVHGDGFSSGPIHTGETFSHTFTTAGTFNYICQIHPFMKGTVTVLDSSSSSGSPSSGASSGSASGSAPSSPTSTPTTTSTSSSTSTGSGSSGAGGSLPMTGFDLWLLALTGIELAAAGALLRRLARG